MAQNITLTSTDKSFTATGGFISFENGVYMISTSLGNMQVNASTVTCEGAACPSLTPETPVVEADVRFAGSDTVGDGLMPLLLAGYGASHNALVEDIPTEDGSIALELIMDEGYGDPMGVFQVDSTTSTDAFPKLLAKTAEFGMASRRIKRDEARALAQDGAGSMIAPEQEHIVAVDSLVVIVNPANPVRSISMHNLARIYRGEIRNWAELGGPDLPIVAYSRPDGSGTRAEGTKVAVVGFTDSDGVFNANRTLSQRRAQQVLAEIKTRANGTLSHIAFESQGFGELAPAGCNTDSEGKRINHRVEVWIQ